MYNNYIIGSQVNYELDAWGRFRNAVATQQNTAHATEAELAAISLSLHAELASDYFSLLLERRPDIAAAEFRVQAANATIGVA